KPNDTPFVWAILILEIKAQCPSMPQKKFLGGVTFNGRTYAIYDWTGSQFGINVQGKSFMHQIDGNRCFLATTNIIYKSGQAETQAATDATNAFYGDIDGILQSLVIN